jgi:hypothetical protein
MRNTLLFISSFFIFFLTSLTLTAYAAVPNIFYSDLTNGPKNTGQNDKGAFVTIWGHSFGDTQGASYVTIGGGQADNYPVWSDNKITFQLGPYALTGNILVHTSEGNSIENIPFTVNSGHVYFATDDNVTGGTGTFDNPWTHAMSFYTQAKPGDILYLRQGTYTAQYGKTFMGAGLQLMTGKTGEENAAIAWIAYPGEDVVFYWGSTRHFYFADKATGAAANYQVISQITMDGAGGTTSGGVESGGFYANEEVGAHHLRIIGCRMTNAAKGSTTTMTGHIRITNDGSKILGNEIDHCGVKGNPFNNNHLIYIQCGADNIEVAYNYMHDNAAGHCIQVHADNPGRYQYDNILIHSNFIKSDGSHDLRGPTMSNVLPDSTLYFYNNVVANIGYFSGFNLVNGTAYIYNNTFYNVGGTGVLSLKDDNEQHMVIKNNIMWSDGTVPYVDFGTYSDEYADWSNVTISNNVYYKSGDGPTQDPYAINTDPLFVDSATNNFKLQPSSQAKDVGVSLSMLPHDRENIARPQGNGWDIGAFEYYVSQTQPPIPIITRSSIQ